MRNHFDDFTGDDTPVNKVVVYGGYVWATNLHVLIRRPQDGEPETGRNVFPNADKLFRKHGFQRGRCVEKFPPNGEMAAEDCESCRATGRELVDCDACRGGGECFCDSCDNGHSCGHCAGTGKTRSPERCRVCKGQRKVAIPADRDIGGKLIAGKYIKLINTLKDVRFRSDGDKGTVLHFVAAGDVEGLSMPMRTEEVKDV